MEREYRGIMWCGCAGVMVLLIILLMCWDPVEPTDYALIYNSISKNVDSQVYEGGRYFLFFTNSFVSFPKTLVSIEFSDSQNSQAPGLQTRTKEGLALTLHISFQYQLIKEKLKNLYTMNNIYYEATFVRISRDIILQEAGKFQAPQFWTNRSSIGDNMRLTLDNALMEIGAHCVSLQMLKIDLPETYENKIVLTQVEVQKKSTKEFEQIATLIRAQMQVDISDANRTIANVSAYGQSQGYITRQQAQAQAINNIISAESSAYQIAMHMLGLKCE